jgi:hypothetical protein
VLDDTGQRDGAGSGAGMAGYYPLEFWSKSVSGGLVSFDLGVWFEPEPITAAEAAAKYERLCDGDLAGVVDNERVTAFYQALTARYPELTDQPETDLDGPWSTTLDRSAGHVIMPIIWPRAAEMRTVVRELAAEHGLVCFDPQTGDVDNPVRPMAPGALRLELCDGSVIDEPDLPRIRRELGRLSSHNWYAVLERSPDWYTQVGLGQEAGVPPGQYGLERREGSAQRHYRYVAKSLDDVVNAFAGFASADDAWIHQFPWQKVDV